ncbi:hypothetical protein G7054_g4943 [Neopestalotiopsis clavispora]|nr:hypothetical protein G7054_g4943 [Neopestalotiopsis clavispora]
MFQRSMFRAVPRLMRSPAMQRRFASTENQFIKEREAVKEHAAATTELWRKISIYDNVRCPFYATTLPTTLPIQCTQRIEIQYEEAGKCSVGQTKHESNSYMINHSLEHGRGTKEKKMHKGESWANHFANNNSAVVPVLILAGANAYNLWAEHWEHWSHMPPLEERVEYPYQNIRTKNYPWGNGDKTLFWNDSVNYHNKDKTT